MAWQAGKGGTCKALGRALLLSCMLPGAAPLGALDFGPSPTGAQWSLRSSPLECRLSQSIPYFGEAVFRQAAGEAGQFQLSSTQRLLPGQASLRIEAPAWREPITPVTLASVPVQSGRVPVQLGESLAERVLSALFEGLSPVIDQLPSNSRTGHSSIRLLAVNFRPAYGDYRACIAGLLPGSFADVSRLRIGYDGGGYELDDAGRRRLDLLVSHLELRKDVKALYVDGYSDHTGRLRENLELSRQRAQAVTDYLVSKGVPAEIITTRYHGSRYPIARGNSAAARAQNRRVTVRVERG